MKTSVSMTLVIADQAAVRAIISPPCFGARPVQRLRWLGSPSKAPEDLERDPIWRTRQRLRLVFGGEALQTAIRCQRSFHHGQIPPKIFQAVSTAKECGEVRRVHQHDISGTLCIWWHPEQAVELRVAGRAERMRTVEINGLARQQMHRLSVLGSQFVMRQVRMEIERRDVFKQAQLV